MMSQPQDIDYLVQLAQTRLDKGITHEPRGYFDVIALELDDGTGLVTNGAPDIFRNSDNYPVKITHATFAVGYFDQAGNVDNVRNTQLIGVNMRFHDQFYMNPTHTLVPAWANKPVNSLDRVSFGASAWRFDNGRWVDDNGGGSFVLSARDSLEVVADLIGNPTYPPIEATVTFTGFGIMSHRPYLLTSSDTFTAEGQPVTFATNDYRNDGGEPIVITDMTTHISNDQGDGSTDAMGDSRRLRVNVRQIGNGTNRQWFQGPAFGPPAIAACPTPLLGITSGRAVVHEFPNPLTWEPGEGISLSAQSNNPAATDPDSYLNVGLFGYVMIA
jgi:hypothetical protein